MKTISIFFGLILTATAAHSTTYTIGSGKWSDPCIWNDQHMGSTIKADDVVIITGQVIINTPLVIEGILQIEKGAGIISTADITVAQSGTLINNGNVVAKGFVKQNGSGTNRDIELVMVMAKPVTVNAVASCDRMAGCDLVQK